VWCTGPLPWGTTEAVAAMNSDDAFDLMPNEIGEQVPPLYSTESQDDPVAFVKWFHPMSNWTWYVLEYDPTERLCFGLVIGHERELGYFSLDEIASVEVPAGIRVERDLHWEPTALSKCR